MDFKKLSLVAALSVSSLLSASDVKNIEQTLTEAECEELTQYQLEITNVRANALAALDQAECEESKEAITRNALDQIDEIDSRHAVLLQKCQDCNMILEMMDNADQACPECKTIA
ncbi:MAG TPA: hypothetical protein VHA52_01545 [Candidatus Babeliaceae bacterium]|nr:hypothetical protein [Candidatus Babeliaceae bacterium]